MKTLIILVLNLKCVQLEAKTSLTLIIFNYGLNLSKYIYELNFDQVNYD